MEPTRKPAEPPADAAPSDRIAQLARLLERRAPLDAAQRLRKESDAIAAAVLEQVNAVFAFKILQRMPRKRREALLPLINRRLGEQWLRNQSHPVGSVGRLMGSVGGTSKPEDTVADTVAELKRIAVTSFFTYVYVTDAAGKLVGVVTMRDLLLGEPTSRLETIMIAEPFHFRPDTPVHEAAREVVHLHYPVYPVCDADGKLVGLVRGYVLFEESAEQLASQAGRMVGVEGEERTNTSWSTSLRLRHPWLQLNMVTALIAAVVIGFYQDLIAQVAILAVFLQVLSSQASNTGCQALAVTLRGITLDEVSPGDIGPMLRKEAWVGLLNGFAVGVTAAGVLMLIEGTGHGHGTTAATLALITVMALSICGVVAGLAGVLVPHTLRKLGADPSTASAIILTTITDVTSASTLLGLASLMIH